MSLFGVESGRTTYGHRTLAGGRIVVTGVADWFAKLRAAHVEPDLAARRARFEEQAKALAAEIGGTPADDAGLLEAWSHLVEWPGLVRGAFEEAFLDLPEEILVTSMREHQKMLPIRRDGALLPAFLAVCDQTGDPKGLIAQGNEWVTSARFADARFFWDDDGKTKLEDRLDAARPAPVPGDARRLPQEDRPRAGPRRAPRRAPAGRRRVVGGPRGAPHEGRPRDGHGARVPGPAGRRGRPLRPARGRARGGLAGDLRPVPAGLGRRRVPAHRRRRRRRARGPARHARRACSASGSSRRARATRTRSAARRSAS